MIASLPRGCRRARLGEPFGTPEMEAGQARAYGADAGTLKARVEAARGAARSRRRGSGRGRRGFQPACRG